MLRFVTVVLFFCLAYSNANKAVVYLFDPSGKSGVSGEVTFESVSDKIHIVGKVSGLSPGLHGFHVHKLGNIGKGCVGAGPHFNPYNETHGAPTDVKRHVGDLGNIEADNDGVANIDFYDSVISLDGETDIIGRGFVVHAGEDDLGKGGDEESLKTGNAGARVACGVIGIL